ncbi:hypothetical protein PBV88_34825 [Streptomyces sp. T21Q-yed]|nr:hypothetical protein [Streptomyces sp. T21Q-yed]
MIGFAVALRPVPVLAEVKILAFVVGGIAGSFALAWLLIARVPGVARVFWPCRSRNCALGFPAQQTVVLDAA